MTIPADSLPGDHLRAEELHECRAALCRFMKENPAPPISSDSVLSSSLEKCLCADAVGAVCLKDSEVVQCREALRTFMGVRETSRGSQSFLERFFEKLSSMSRSTFPRMIAACCVLLILGNSVALAANATLPGDTLYPVKVNVLEPARAIVTVSAEGKATWASTCIRRRLIEAERLIAEDRLTTETWKSLNDSIASNTRVAERHIIRLSKQNAPEAVDLSADLHLMINAHGQVFSDVGETHQQEAVITAAADLSSAAADTGRLYQETEELAAANVMNVEETAVRVMESASSAAFTLGEAADATVQTIPDQAKERGDIARQFLTSAKNRFQAGEFKESLRDARMAVQKAEEGKAFVRMALPFTIGASSNGSMMAVPITVCGSAIINVSVPAVAEPTQQPTSSASSKKNESSSSEQSIVSQVSSQSSSSSVPASTSSSSTIDSSSSVVVSSSKTETPSSTSTQTSSIASRNSSKPLIELPPLVPELPLLH